MTVVTISIHKHECAICGSTFTRRGMAGQDRCQCGATADYTEFCPTCQAEADEAGWLGKIVVRLIERTISLDRRLEAVEGTRIKVVEPFKELHEATEEVKRLWNSAASFDGTEGTVPTQAMERLLSALSLVTAEPR